MARYLANGELDTAFGTGGKVVTAYSSESDIGKSVALQVDGKILLGGYLNNGTDADFAVARYDSNGQLDTAFGINGVTTADFDGAIDFGQSVAVQPDGRILLGGFSRGRNDSYYNATLVRFDPTGSLDSTFGTGGRIQVDPAICYSIAIQNDGRILMGGYTGVSGQSEFYLTRLNTNGTRDTSFGAGGTVTTDIAPGDDLAYSVAVRPDGRILLGGSTYARSTSLSGNFALAQYLPNGALDTTFGVGGKATADLAGADDALSLALQPDGKAVLGGYTNNGSGRDFALVRFEGFPDSQAPTCQIGGVVSGTEDGVPVVYVPITVADSGTGVASVQLTARSSNCRLVSVTTKTSVPVGQTLRFSPSISTTVVRAYKLNLSQSARVELLASDGAGNAMTCDPVIANLNVSKSRRLNRTFKQIPQQEHWLSLQNGSPGLGEVRIWVNGYIVRRDSLVGGQLISINISPWTRPGAKNTVRIAATGTRDASAVLMIGDAASKAVGTPSRAANLEFSR